MIKLYDYCRSTASYRVRIALNIKQLSHELCEVHLLQEGGQQFSSAYHALNPQHLVPTLVDGSIVVNQSMAIIEYLDETYPSPALLPKTPSDKATVRALAQMIACDIHPLNNLRVLKYLQGELHVSDKQKQQWYHHWVLQGFTAVENMLQKLGSSGNFCYGDSVTLADLVLIPQVYNANRFQCPLDDFPLIKKINAHCLQLSAFAKAILCAE